MLARTTPYSIENIVRGKCKRGGTAKGGCSSLPFGRGPGARPPFRGAVFFLGGGGKSMNLWLSIGGVENSKVKGAPLCVPAKSHLWLGSTSLGLGHGA